MTTNQKQTYPLIDLAKFVLSLLIALYHIIVLYGTVFPSRAVQYILLQGGNFVAVLFMLFGFFAAGKLDTIGEGRLGYERFIGGRIVRLLPLTAVSTAVLFLLSSLFIILFNEAWCARPFSFDRLVLNITGVSIWCGDKEPINGPTWFVSVLLFCNILFYFISSRKISKSIKLTLFTLLAVLGIGLMATNCDFPLLYPRMGRGYSAFFSGVLFGCLYPVLSVKARRAALLAGTGLLLFTAGLTGYGSSVVNNLYLFFALFGTPLLILAAGELRFGGLPARVCRFLGQISYSIYLWNLPILIVSATVCRLCGIEPFIGSWACLGIYAGLHILVGALSFLFIERPLTARLTCKLEHLLSRTESGPAEAAGRISL